MQYFPRNANSCISDLVYATWENVREGGLQTVNHTANYDKIMYFCSQHFQGKRSSPHCWKPGVWEGHRDLGVACCSCVTHRCLCTIGTNGYTVQKASGFSTVVKIVFILWASCKGFRDHPLSLPRGPWTTDRDHVPPQSASPNIKPSPLWLVFLFCKV